MQVVRRRRAARFISRTIWDCGRKHPGMYRWARPFGSRSRMIALEGIHDTYSTAAWYGCCASSRGLGPEPGLGWPAMQSPYGGRSDLFEVGAVSLARVALCPRAPRRPEPSDSALHRGATGRDGQQSQKVVCGSSPRRRKPLRAGPVVRGPVRQAPARSRVSEANNNKKKGG